MLPQDNIIAAVPRKVYANAHAYHIHSISVNSDQETYISADDLRINLWNLGISDQSFSKYPLSDQDEALIIDRYCGYQACEYGRVDRSDNRCGISSTTVQPFHVLELQKQY